MIRIFFLITIYLVFLKKIDSTENIRYNYPRSCSDLSGAPSGVYRIFPEYGFGDPIEVYCNQTYDKGGWIVIQNRFDGSTHFYRGWQDYEHGFGNWGSEFWLGLKSIHRITYSQRFELLIELSDSVGSTRIAKYSYFLLAGPEAQYKLSSLGEYSGSAGDSLSYAVGSPFSTFDRKNDGNKDNCAAIFKGAWWYSNVHCHKGNLNGIYLEGLQSEFATMMCWSTWKGYYYGLKSSRMMIRPTLPSK
ncbi:microfibril-associated glycoprotein 4-like [Uranotaenia lowii]|uniref:microfibril-associated glycoprotein 4-like n=1 Tax=Uranotaenia lowii TaxID=190385 RepID=UPI002479AC39|nr:microfibril-associated glycoprotein 4-like [Uranotaenia lowii]